MRRKPAEVGPDEVRTGGDFEREPVPDGDADALWDILLADNARVVIEIGFAYGSSALAIAEALVAQGAEGTNHVIIDAYQDRVQDSEGLKT
jgi:predicted O-methyltransferase YrrM